MELNQRLLSLTSLEVVLASLLRGLKPSKVIELPLSEALGCVVAELPQLKAYPPHDIAVTDGWALRARDLVGASSYSPLALANLPSWVEAGDRIPEGCDCVLDVGAVDQTGSIVQVLAEANPGQGIRRTGGDLSEGVAVTPGFRFRPLDMMVAQAAGWEKMRLRRPRVRIVNVPAITGERITLPLIEESVRNSGAEVVSAEARSRDAVSIAQALDATACDLLITIGGSGVGRRDATIAALTRQGELLAHGIALQPGRTSAIARIGSTPVIALPGAADQALGALWALVLPALDRLSDRQPRRTSSLPLARKIASSVGIAEIALLAQKDATWVPLAIGDLSLQVLAGADARLIVPGGSEGFSAGTLVAAHMLRD